jgi:predicted ABC-type transport system involved in lysophospholipase L1 biosynthesis ATPase subunit
VTPPGVLEFAGVVKTYGGLRPLRIADLHVTAADRIALLGFDQASAEVFVNLATGATLPDTGDIRICGRPTRSIDDPADWLSTVDRFGIVSDRAVLLDSLTVIQNLAMPFTLEIEPPPDDVRHRAESLAREVGLPETSWMQPVASLDAAGWLRVRLGRAIALAPSILLLEHASAHLSREEVASVGAMIRTVAAARGIALVAVAGDEVFATAVADRVLTLEPATGRLKSPRRWFGRPGSW